MPVSINGSGAITFNDGSIQNTAATGFGFKNRILNGGMVLDQRNAGASVTPTAATIVYTLDRWLAYQNQSSRFSVQQNAGSVTPPTGFTNYLGVTSLASTTPASSDINVLVQRIEGFNVADLGFGTASASAVTLSFWVRSSLTGTFGASIKNSASNRSYPFSFVISSANTWEQKSITISGDTTGTWLTNNGIGLALTFDLGSGSTYKGTANAWSASDLFAPTGSTNLVGTNGATFYITGVQLEKGSTATSFDYRPYGTELLLCQRYYYRTPDQNSLTNIITVSNESTGNAAGGTPHPVSMRAAPTITLGSGIRYYSATTATITTSIISNRSTIATFAADFSISGATAGQAGSIFRGTTNGFLEANAEL